MLTVIEVFRLAGRGTAVVGCIESGVLESGQTVEILDGEELVATARANVEMIASRQAAPGVISLLLSDLDASLPSSGHTIRRLRHQPAPPDQDNHGIGALPRADQM